jgi:putative ABC transport system permease protein
MPFQFRSAARSLTRTPGFTALAAVTLALGIGATTALFSVVDAVLLRPLPFPRPERLAVIWETKIKAARDTVPFSYPNFDDVRSQARTFDNMGAVALARLTIAGDPQPEQVQGGYVTSSFFPTLGVEPILGGGFVPADDRPGRPARVLIGHGLGQRRFGSSPAAVGRSMIIDGRVFEIGGVLPASFRFSNLSRETELWLPLGHDPFTARRFARPVRGMRVVGRMAPGVDLARAQTDLYTIAKRLEAAHPGDNADMGLRTILIQDQATGQVRPAVLVLNGAVALVLLIACANVANLLLVRTTARQREMSVRAALGARRSRLFVQLITESTLLGLLGGMGGLLVALWGVDLLSRAPLEAGSAFSPFNPRLTEIGLHWTAFAFASGLSLVTGVAVGVLPAWQATRAGAGDGLKESAPTGTAGPRRHRALGALVVVQVALTVMLLSGALLTGTSLVRLLDVNPGFTASGVLTFELNLPGSKYREPHLVTSFHERLFERVRALPGVTAAGAVEYLPLSGGDGSTYLYVADLPPALPGHEPRAHYRSVTPDYFAAMGIPIRTGRAFTADDRPGGVRPALVNERLARQLWPGQRPIGKRLALPFESLRYYRDRAPDFVPELGMREVVGVVADVKHSGLDADAPPEVYVPFAQRTVHDMTVVVATSGDAASLAGMVRREVRAIDADQPVANLRTVDEILARSLAPPRFHSTLIGVFAVVALALTGVGIYGVLGFVVSQRTRETGVRMAFGAGRRDIVRIVAGRGARLAIVGLVIGLGGAAAVARLLSRLLFGVTAAEPAVYASSAAIVLAIALAACYLPARRAAMTDPIVALRHD